MGAATSTNNDSVRSPEPLEDPGWVILCQLQFAHLTDGDKGPRPVSLTGSVRWTSDNIIDVKRNEKVSNVWVRSVKTKLTQPDRRAPQTVDWEDPENHPGLCESHKRPLLSGINYPQGRGVRAVCSLSGLLGHLTLWDINPQDSLVIFNLHQCLLLSSVPVFFYLWGCLLLYRLMSQEGRTWLQISLLSQLRE